MSSRSTIKSPAESNSAAACNPPVRPKVSCDGRARSGNLQSTFALIRNPEFSGRIFRARTESIEAFPHTPQLEFAAKYRRELDDGIRAPRASFTRTRFRP